MLGVLVIFLLALISGLLIVQAPAAKLPKDKTQEILAALPQTQCGQCNYAGCQPYADAIVKNEADINQCPPGGVALIKTLADLLGCQSKPLNPKNGLEKEKHVAFIDEKLCIGCVKCINACPVDAILGAAKQMHSVLSKECTGCELCLSPCPMDCISMQALTP